MRKLRIAAFSNRGEQRHVQLSSHESWPPRRDVDEVPSASPTSRGMLLQPDGMANVHALPVEREHGPRLREHHSGHLALEYPTHDLHQKFYPTNAELTFAHVSCH